MNFNTNPASRFDQGAAQWDNNPTRVKLARAVGSAICKAVPIEPHWRGLDYGAGTGLLTLSLQPYVSSILAVDFSAGMLDTLSSKLASAGIKNVQVRQWNLESQPFPEMRFDLVVSSMTLHHLRDVPLSLARMAKTLRPGGWIAVADLDMEDGSFHAESGDVFHRGFARDQIKEWLTDSGCNQISIGDAHTIRKPSATGPRRDYGVFLATGQKKAGLKVRRAA